MELLEKDHPDELPLLAVVKTDHLPHYQFMFKEFILR